jgi:hypothetical protein
MFPVCWTIISLCLSILFNVLRISRDILKIQYVPNQQENADNYFLDQYSGDICIGCSVDIIWDWLGQATHRSWRSMSRKDAVEGDFICSPMSKYCENLSLTVGVGTHRPGNICPLYISSLGRFIQGLNRPVWRVIQEMYHTRDASSKNKYAGTQRSGTHCYGVVQNLHIYNSASFKGTQEWEFFWLRFWILYYFIVSYVKILRFCKKTVWMGQYWRRYNFSA